MEIMPISLAFDTPHFNFSSPAPKPRFSSAKRAALLSDEEADRLLGNLVQFRWSRLACQDADPLGMLFNDRAKQWTAGWEPQQQALLLLVWEIDSWQNKPKWSLYRNGQLIYQAVDGLTAQRRQWLNQLLEGPQPPFIDATEFLSRLSDFRFSEVQRRQAAEQLQQTVAIIPEIVEALKDALLTALETDLGNPEWPVLEVLKLHRLAHKNPLITLLRNWIQQGLMTDASDAVRFNRALNQLQQDYSIQSRKIQPLFQPSYQQAYQEFKILLTSVSNGLWQTPLRPAQRRA
jgi:hypothetical protein